MINLLFINETNEMSFTIKFTYIVFILGFGRLIANKYLCIIQEAQNVHVWLIAISRGSLPKRSNYSFGVKHAPNGPFRKCQSLSFITVHGQF